MMRWQLVVMFLLFCAPAAAQTQAIDAASQRVLNMTRANGMAVAVIEDGQVRHVAAFGMRNAKGEKLQTDTVMYGASLTKAVFATAVMQLVDAGRLDLDRPLAAYLEKPLPDYAPYAALKNDPRWQQITARHALTHSTGFANFAFLEPERKLRIHFDPGTRYAY